MPKPPKAQLIMAGFADIVECANAVTNIIEQGIIPAGLEMMAKMAELSEIYNLRVANVFHAGDGNLHPLILYDANKEGEEFGQKILELCIEVGGTITGEHGIGVEKLDSMCSQFTAP